MKLIGEFQAPFIAKSRSKVNGFGASQHPYRRMTVYAKDKQHSSGVCAFHLSASTGEKLLGPQPFDGATRSRNILVKDTSCDHMRPPFRRLSSKDFQVFFFFSAMVPNYWVYILLGSPVCLALTLDPQGRITTAGNSSAETNFRSSGFQNITLPPTLPSLWIGGNRSSETERGAADLNAPTRCDASRYGRPNRKSCEEVWGKMPIGTRLQTFGNRTEGSRWDVALPFRYISRQFFIQRLAILLCHLADERKVTVCALSR